MPSPLCPVGGTSLGSDRGVGGGASACTRPTSQTLPRGARPASGSCRVALAAGSGPAPSCDDHAAPRLRRGPDSRAPPPLADLGAEAPAGQGSPGRRHCSARGARLWGRACRGHSPPASVRGPCFVLRAVGMLSVVTVATGAGLRGGGTGRTRPDDREAPRALAPGSSAAVSGTSGDALRPLPSQPLGSRVSQRAGLSAGPVSSPGH